MAAILQVVNGDGEYNASGVTSFVLETGVESAGVDYTVVAIMGPQSSGKSTLLNNLVRKLNTQLIFIPYFTLINLHFLLFIFQFGTRFQEMDALTGRQQTTHGIWLASSPKVLAPPTLVMDLEGSDGRERGEDDTSFERQSALFALATADILLVNMWAKDVGREAGAGKPLLKTIFQVNLKLFQPSPGARRTVLLFVLRDRTKTPLEKLKETWEADLQRMWDSIAKPPAYENSAIVDFFEIQYAVLSNYEDRPDEFLAETTLLRRRFTEDADDSEGLLRQSAHKLPGQALSLSMGKVWEVIHDNKDLNLPAHRVMVANIRCAEIAAEQLSLFESSPDWEALAAEAQEDLVPGFGGKAAALLDAALTAYEEEARYFDAGVSSVRQETLTTELHALVRTPFDSQLALACSVALDSFRLGMITSIATTSSTATFVAKAAQCAAAALTEFDAAAATTIIPGTEWTAAAARDSLQRELVAHQAALKAAHVATVFEAAKVAVEAGVSAGAMPLLESPPLDLWPRLSAVVDREAKSAATTLSKSLHGYGLEAAEEGDVRGRVRLAARSRLMANAKEAANTALPRLKDRFQDVFQKDEQGMPRTWSPAVDIPGVAAEAKRAAAMLLSQLCIVRITASASTTTTASATAASVKSGGRDVVECAILQLAEPGSKSSTGPVGLQTLLSTNTTTITSTSALAAATTASSSSSANFDLVSASEWPNIAAEDVLLSPAQARSVWRQFSSDVALTVQQAVATQEANKLAQNKLPPFWAIATMIVLGFNEFVAVLRNPLLLALLVVLFMFGRTVYNELDVESEMSRGLLPGVMSLSAKFVPTVKAVTLRTFESGKQLLAEGGGGGGGAAGEDGGGGGGFTPSPARRVDGVAGGRVRFDTGGEGLRARKKEVEMSYSDDGGGVVGGGVVGGDLLSMDDGKDE